MPEVIFPFTLATQFVNTITYFLGQGSVQANAMVSFALLVHPHFQKSNRMHLGLGEW